MFSNVSNIEVKTVEPDLMSFICPECGLSMRVGFVKQHVISSHPPRQKCTFIYLRCDPCGLDGHRKFYWFTKAKSKPVDADLQIQRDSTSSSADMVDYAESKDPNNDSPGPQGTDS